MNLISCLKGSRPISVSPFGWALFQIGLFLLPSSAFLSGCFLIIALILQSSRRTTFYWSDPWNYPFALSAILMFLGSIKAYSGWLAWIGLANWIPFFWCFWAFQPYLLTSQARKSSSFCLIAGTVPVCITGFGQLWLGWEGPWELFSGLVVWFVDAGGQPTGRLSGLFNYANIAGAWLAMIWPLALATLLQKSLSRRYKIVVLLLAISIVAALILTESRNAWAGLILAIPFVLGPAPWPWVLPILFLLLFPVALATLPWVNVDIQQWARKVVPEDLWTRLLRLGSEERAFATTRLSQWQLAIKYFSERPLFGWGAAAFSILYPLSTGLWHGHAHNLPLEIAVSHGIPVALLIVVPVLALLIISLRTGFFKVELKNSGTFDENLFDRAWWTASFILIFLHASDMPFFDSRLNIAGWLFLSGLRCLIRPSQSMLSDS